MFFTDSKNTIFATYINLLNVDIYIDRNVATDFNENNATSETSNKDRWRHGLLLLTFQKKKPKIVSVLFRVRGNQGFQATSKMWQEARKQEKRIRGMMVDHKKRAERRREYYEKIVRNIC